METLTIFWHWLTNVLTTEFFAALAAALTFIVAWRQHVWNKRNYLASVKPLICDFLHRDFKKLSLSFSISNKGLGPAKLLSYEFELDGKTVSRQVVESFMGTAFTGDFYCYLVEMSDVSAFSTNDSQLILSVNFQSKDSIDQHDRESFLEFNKQLVRRLKLIIRYTSVLDDETFTYKTTPLQSLLNENS